MAKSAQTDLVKVSEQCQISPPPSSVSTTSFPLTFFDMAWITGCPVPIVFVYNVSFSDAQFAEQVLPQLKNSLSLALQRFPPLCGNLVVPPLPSEPPYILYKYGDSVLFLVAQSTGIFGNFLTDEPKDAKEIYILLPPTTSTYVSDDDTLVKFTPLFSVQVTLFPNSGISIGINFRHVAADGMSISHFMKTWAAIFKANCDMSLVSISLPVLDKSVIMDSNGIKQVLTDQWRAQGSPSWNQPDDHLMEDKVRATFTFSRDQINSLKRYIMTKCANGTESTTTSPANFHFSTFVVTCAFIWVCVIKSLDAINPSKDEEELCHFLITADCRNKYDLWIPAAFFGNCISPKFVSVARSTFAQEHCITTVAEAMSNVVQSFRDSALDWYKYPSMKGKVFARRENILGVTCSPKLGLYETDFGWGRPAKIKVVPIDVLGSISLSESGDEEGGIEVGICRSRQQLSIFTSFFEACLNQILV